VQGGLVPFAMMMGIVAGLIMLEPNFSVTIIILVIGVTMFFVGGGNIKQLGLSGVIGAAFLGLVIWRSGHGHIRIENWWNSLFDPSLASYDVSQAMTVIKLGHGIDTAQSNYMLKATVPLLWSDYLFANVGSDLGFIGTISVVILFAALAYRGLGIALNARDQFAALTAIGITTWLLTQALIHIGASLALIPTTGVPLPFMSYGGSSLVANMAAIGILLNISRASPVKRAPYADFAFGWWHGRPRVSDPQRGQLVAGADPPAPVAKRRRRVISKRPF
jgi:cell division protein FtsW